MTIEERAVGGPLEYIDLGIGGMTCDDCTRTVGSALESVAGVAEADVSLERRSARVTLAAPVAPEHLTEAVRVSGYNAFTRSGGGR